MNPKEWLTIPTLPCASLDETITFWVSLGFEKTYYQKSPNPYGVIARGDYELHFYSFKGFNPLENYSGCLIMVTDVEQVHQAFADRFRETLGKVPQSGLPRISRMRPGQTRFTLTDPSGNSVIFIKFGQEDAEIYDEVNKDGITRLQKAMANAVRFRDFKYDNGAAATVLDVALERSQNEKPADIAQALLMRLELAIDMGDSTREQTCYSALKQLTLSADEIIIIKDKLKITADIEQFFAS